MQIGKIVNCNVLRGTLIAVIYNRQICGHDHDLCEVLGSPLDKIYNCQMSQLCHTEEDMLFKLLLSNQSPLAHPLQPQ